MKCYKHPAKDAIASCSSCNKGVCRDCEVDVEGKIFCKDCVAKGSAKKSQASSEEKNPLLALLLSFVLSGLGQIYNGELNKGIILLVAYFISWFLTMFFIGCCTTPVVWLYGMYDAYTTAEKINKGEKNA